MQIAYPSIEERSASVLSEELREQVRQRANYACEYCGVSEIDTGDQLTVDHFQPYAAGGTDQSDNLVYCCYRCNLYKADYWHCQPGESVLWNPRLAPMGTHFLTLADGTLYPITATGEFTLRRLRLNRAPLIGDNYPSPLATIAIPHAPEAKLAGVGAWRSGGSRSAATATVAQPGPHPSRRSPPFTPPSGVPLLASASPTLPGSSARSSPRSRCDVPAGRSPLPSSSDP